MIGRSKLGPAWLLVPLLVFLSGCASTQETSTLQQSLGMLNERQANLERRLESSEGQAKKSGDLYSRIEELQMRVGALTGRIEELQHKIDQMQRAAAAAPPAQSAPAQVQGEPEAAPVQSYREEAPVAPPARFSAPPPQGAAQERDNPEKAAFERASQLFQQGKYDAARKEFQSYYSKYPKSETADNALFSVGECYFAEKKYQDAIEAYQQVLDRFPKGNRVPYALLKQGNSFQQIGDSTAARIIFERLVEKYPGTPQAQIAEKKLKQMP